MRSDASEMRLAAVGNSKKSRLRALATAFDNIWPGAAPASAYLAMVSTSAMTWIALRHLWRIKHTSMEPHFSSPTSKGRWRRCAPVAVDQMTTLTMRQPRSRLPCSVLILILPACIILKLLNQCLAGSYTERQWWHQSAVQVISSPVDLLLKTPPGSTWWPMVALPPTSSEHLVRVIHFCKLEENDKLVLTPFEKNVDIWRQLWRVLERSDLVANGMMERRGSKDGGRSGAKVDGDGQGIAAADPGRTTRGRGSGRPI
ncbi:Os05g0580800 [Oryza sativa Japonica Group]|uniref:Os05g0580800 protein n=1 Tax=Oryza sativa subsp. japonica TaxID=39947 RepID=A0A0P0WRD4_ORYSJ|nr:hypothetical protein EE612_031344 [Oryza sativa]BAS95520.1 Os05g0580800 [Oryza sativa Japonica Group]